MLVQVTWKSVPTRAAPTRCVTSTVSPELARYSAILVSAESDISQNGATPQRAALKTLAGLGEWIHRPAPPCLAGRVALAMLPCPLRASRASWLITGQARTRAPHCCGNLAVYYSPFWRLPLRRKSCHRRSWLGWCSTARAARPTFAICWPGFSLIRRLDMVEDRPAA